MKRLGSLEALVMDRLWSSGRPLLVREVLAELPGEQHRAYTTVMTVLDNLFRKGYVRRDMEGRAYRYAPVDSREQHTALVMEELLASGGDRGTTLMHFVEHMDPEEADRLSAVLSALDRETRR